MADVEGFDERYPLNSRLVKQDGRLVEEVYRVGGRYGPRSGGSWDTSKRRSRTRPRRWRAALARSSGSTGPARPATGVRTTSPGSRIGIRRRHDQRLRRGLHGRARREGRMGVAGLLREPRQDGGHPDHRRRTRSGSRTACRGIRSWRKPQVDRRLGARHRRHRRGGRLRPGHARSASTCPTTRTSASATAASRCRCPTSPRPTNSRRRREFRREFAWSPRKWRAPRRWSALPRADDEHARDDRPRVRAGVGNALKGTPREGAEGALVGARGGARRSGRALLRRRSVSWSSSGSSTAEIHDEIVVRRVRGATPATRWCSCAASAKARRSRKTTCATGR